MVQGVQACNLGVPIFLWPRNWNTRRDKQRVCRQRGHEASNPGDCPAASHPPRPSAFSKLAPKFRILLGELPTWGQTGSSIIQDYASALCSTACMGMTSMPRGSMFGRVTLA